MPLIKDSSKNPNGKPQSFFFVTSSCVIAHIRVLKEFIVSQHFDMMICAAGEDGAWGTG